jgi:glycosyltransferase involved in cell wall biosynthesis
MASRCHGLRQLVLAFARIAAQRGASTLKPVELALVVYGLSENWLGGVNYYRNLLAVFDGAAQRDLRLNVFTNNADFFADMRLSERVALHRISMLEHRKPAWFLRKVVAKATGRDWLLLRQLRRLGVRAIVFSHVPGASESGIRCLPWIPDFQSQRHPEFFQPNVVAIERRRAQEWSQSGDGLIVISVAARYDAVTLFKADPRRLHVMRFAPRLEGAKLASSTLRDEVLARHGITRPYFFLPNQYWQHKNHRLVLLAMQRLRALGAALPLVISTGKTDDPRDPMYFKGFEAAVHTAGLQAHYRMLGVIDRQDMLVLLAHAVAVINPSRFEGWSSSVEEAKALGKALLVSDIPVHREQIAGRPDAKLFGVDDADTLATQMHQHGQHVGAVTDYPPSPDTSLYLGFESQYIALLRDIAHRTEAS